MAQLAPTHAFLLCLKLKASIEHILTPRAIIILIKRFIYIVNFATNQSRWPSENTKNSRRNWFCIDGGNYTIKCSHIVVATIAQTANEAYLQTLLAREEAGDWRGDLKKSVCLV